MITETVIPEDYLNDQNKLTAAFLNHLQSASSKFADLHPKHADEIKGMFHELITTGPDTDGNLHDNSTLTASLSVSQCFPRCLSLRRSLSFPSLRPRSLFLIALLAPRLLHSTASCFSRHRLYKSVPFLRSLFFSPPASALDPSHCLVPFLSFNKPALSLTLLLHLLRCPLSRCRSLRCPDCTAPFLAVCLLTPPRGADPRQSAEYPWTPARAAISG